MRQLFTYLWLTCLLSPSFSLLQAQNQALPARIAFGSCAKEYKDQPILESVVAQAPDMFIYLGDNIYGDTEDMDLLRKKYAELGAKPEFQKLRETAIVKAVWDDHDYGQNDAGKHYPKKEESKEIFLEFWHEPLNSSRRQHEGIYHSEYYAEGDQILQLILLDTRTFRDDLKLTESKPDLHKYARNNDPNVSMLGEAQWNWLEEELKKPATFRIIASSTQFLHQYNGWESWNNFPLEQARMFELIRKTKAEGVVILSGDVHFSELSMRKMEGLYPLYDITSSGLTHTIPLHWPNEFRVGNAYNHKCFGMLSIDWESDDPSLTFELKSKKGKTVLKEVIRHSDLTFENAD